MRNKLIAGLLALPLMALSMSALAADGAVGRWKTIDDETGKAMTIVEVYAAKNDTYAAKIVENIAAPANCDKCSGKDKGKSIIGMPVLWGMKKASDGFTGGNGFKPSSGDSFKVKSVKLVDGGKKLEITGCKLVFCRSAHWERAQ